MRRPPAAVLSEHLGTLDERLLTEAKRGPLIDRVEHECRNGYKEATDRLLELQNAYRDALEAAVDADGEEYEELLAEAVELEADHELAIRRYETRGELFAVVLVVQALRETGKGEVPSPAVTEKPVRERLANAALPEGRTEDYLGTARGVLEIEPDPLAWGPPPDADWSDDRESREPRDIEEPDRDVAGLLSDADPDMDEDPSGSAVDPEG